MSGKCRKNGTNASNARVALQDDLRSEVNNLSSTARLGLAEKGIISK